MMSLLLVSYERMDQFTKQKKSPSTFSFCINHSKKRLNLIDGIASPSLQTHQVYFLNDQRLARVLLRT